MQVLRLPGVHVADRDPQRRNGALDRRQATATSDPAEGRGKSVLRTPGPTGPATSTAISHCMLPSVSASSRSGRGGAKSRTTIAGFAFQVRTSDRSSPSKRCSSLPEVEDGVRDARLRAADLDLVGREPTPLLSLGGEDVLEVRRVAHPDEAESGPAIGVENGLFQAERSEARIGGGLLVFLLREHGEGFLGDVALLVAEPVDVADEDPLPLPGRRTRTRSSMPLAQSGETRISAFG